jgi:hypothetical protein
MPYAMMMDGALLRIRLDGTLSEGDLRGLADDVLALESRVLPIRSRVTDMTGVTRMHVGFDEILELAERRRASPPPHPIRSALLVVHQVQLGVARMFQTLNDHPLLAVEIFRDAPAALAWAGGGSDDVRRAVNPPAPSPPIAEGFLEGPPASA